MSDKYIPGGSKIEITAPNGNGTQGASADSTCCIHLHSVRVVPDRQLQFPEALCSPVLSLALMMGLPTLLRAMCLPQVLCVAGFLFQQSNAMRTNKAMTCDMPMFFC